MADYVYVRRTTGSTNEVFYQDGSRAFAIDGIGEWVVSYKASSEVAIRMGVYRTGLLFGFVFVTSDIITGIDLRMISPTFVTVGTVQNINVPIGDGYGGYYNTFAFTPYDPQFNYTVFTSQEDCIHALAYPATPEPGTGVVVTVNAQPVDVPTPDEGVVVYVTGRLLDPNAQGGYSTTGGGTGTFDNTSDPIPISEVPPLTAANSGLLTLFRPSLSQLQALGEYLWTNIADVPDNIKKLFSNPMDYFIAFHIVPVVPDVGASRVIKLGLWSTQVSMPPVTSQWYEADCGTVAVPPYWGNALDYSPYTKITAFLPFIGSVSLNADEVMGKTIGLKYRIDLLSGQCVAILSIDGDALYQFTGQCSVSVPLTGADWSRVYSAAIGATTALVAGVAGVAGATGVSMAGQTNAAAEAAMGAGMAGTAFADLSTAAKGVKGVVAMREEMLKAAQSANAATTQMAASGVRKSAAVKAAAASYGVSNVAGNVMSAKPTVQHAGSVSGAAGFLGIRKPYIYIEFPNQSLAENYKHFVGYPSNMFAKLSTLSGFTQCESVIVKGINATDDEIAEITEGLKAGVYL